MATTRRWNVLVTTAILLTSITLYCYLLPRLYWVPLWQREDLKTGFGKLEHGHGPVTHPHDESKARDLSLVLHPEQHIQRPAKTFELEWNITRAERRPDGVAKQVYLINGEFPGPMIEARSGDQLRITIRNLLEDGEGTAIHYHGLQTSNDVDGIVGLTQCPILPNRTFTYTLQIEDDQAGTFWYHSHYETQRADGLFGAFVVHQPVDAISIAENRNFDYDQEQVLMIGDWYHRSAVEVQDYYEDWRNFKIEPAPDSLLLNGQGYFDCSRAVPARPLDCENLGVPRMLLPSGRTRLRIVNTGAMTGFSIAIPGTTMTLIKVDGGHDVESSPAVESVGILYPGERIDVIVESLDTAVGDGAWITITLDLSNLRFPNLALTSIQRFPVVSALTSSLDPPHVPTGTHTNETQTTRLDLATITGATLPLGTLPLEATETILLYTTIAYLSEYSNRPKGMLNRTIWTLPALTPSQPLPLLALDRSVWPAALLIPSLPVGIWVDIVLNNVDDKPHPFHLHGHAFYLLASYKPPQVGVYAAYNPFAYNEPPLSGPMNVWSPLRKDTVVVPSRGFVVLRFWTERRGLWALHCHVGLHAAVGMGMAIEVGMEGVGQEAMGLRKAAERGCLPPAS